MKANTLLSVSALSLDFLLRKSIVYRRQIISIIYSVKAGHMGGSLSCIDVLNILYNQVMDITPETLFLRKYKAFQLNNANRGHFNS